MSKYIPPHLRAKVQTSNDDDDDDVEKIIKSTNSISLLNADLSIQEILGLSCASRCKEWILPGESVCIHHKYFSHPSSHSICKYFEQTKEFMRWLRLKRLAGKGNQFINNCFIKKVKDLRSIDRQHQGTRSSSIQYKAEGLFNRFLRYAADIDNGTRFVRDAVEIASSTNDFTFLDIGFAPGGMSSLLLDAHPACRGIGINLDVARGGNVYPTFLEESRFADGGPRFKVITADVIELARSKINFKTHFMPDLSISGGFDLVIIGITTSGSNQKQDFGMDELELKNLLHFSQILLAFKFLKPGGRILIRMHLSLRVVDLHMLSLMIENFSNLPIVTKPLTEFAMRKTYWLYTTGFNPNQLACDRLTQLIKLNDKAPYAQRQDGAIGDLNNPIAMLESVDQILQKYGLIITNLLKPIWASQSLILEAIMHGFTDKLCFKCSRVSNYFCGRCRKNVPSSIKDAIAAGESRLRLTTKQLLFE